MSGVPKRPFRHRDSNAEPLHESENLHRLRQIRIAVIRDAGLPEILLGHAAERAARTLNLDAIIELGDPHRSVGSFVNPVHERIAHDFPER